MNFSLTSQNIGNSDKSKTYPIKRETLFMWLLPQTTPFWNSQKRNSIYVEAPSILCTSTSIACLPSLCKFQSPKMEAPKTIAHEIGGVRNDAFRFGLQGVKSDIVGSHPLESAYQSVISLF